MRPDQSGADLILPLGGTDSTFQYSRNVVMLAASEPLGQGTLTDGL